MDHRLFRPNISRIIEILNWKKESEGEIEKLKQSYEQRLKQSEIENSKKMAKLKEEQDRELPFNWCSARWPSKNWIKLQLYRTRADTCPSKRWTGWLRLAMDYDRLKLRILVCLTLLDFDNIPKIRTENELFLICGIWMKILSWPGC